MLSHYLSETINDIRTPTPFTLLNTVYDITGCATDPVTDIITFIAVVDNSEYTASCTATYSTASEVIQTYVFTGLTPATLTLGEEIYMVRQIHAFILMLNNLI